MTRKPADEISESVAKAALRGGLPLWSHQAGALFGLRLCTFSPVRADCLPSVQSMNSDLWIRGNVMHGGTGEICPRGKKRGAEVGKHLQRSSEMQLVDRLCGGGDSADYGNTVIKKQCPK